MHDPRGFSFRHRYPTVNSLNFCKFGIQRTAIKHVVSADNRLSEEKGKTVLKLAFIFSRSGSKRLDQICNDLKRSGMVRTS
jgi:hypothetical protein